MGEESFQRAKLTLELRAAREELTRLEAERLRLSRKNERLTATLYELRHEHALPELALARIEDALAFDGQPWGSRAGDEEDSEDGSEDDGTNELDDELKSELDDVLEDEPESGAR